MRRTGSCFIINLGYKLPLLRLCPFEAVDPWERGLMCKASPTFTSILPGFEISMPARLGWKHDFNFVFCGLFEGTDMFTYTRLQPLQPYSLTSYCTKPYCTIPSTVPTGRSTMLMQPSTMFFRASSELTFWPAR